MAHPKRKISKSRRDKRRTHYKASAPSIAKCSNCGEIKLSHRACPNCGYYAGRSMFVPES
ncbi:MAG: 50S ribosomal protein L32 [Melioribacteraceae bacterium]|jgi:large subunit ribosomal protein L32|nr:50S ribosomal protein L32 [Ignavibacteriota bacterium]MBZ0184096.1 50S ribosomal protein L32 [Melioribacteraceae bacterium]